MEDRFNLYVKKHRLDRFCFICNEEDIELYDIYFGLYLSVLTLQTHCSLHSPYLTLTRWAILCDDLKMIQPSTTRQS